MQQTLLQDIVRTRVDRDHYFDKLRSIEVGLLLVIIFVVVFLRSAIDNQMNSFGLRVGE